MGLFDAFKKLGDLGKKGLSRINKEVKYRRRLKQVKKELLNRFKMSQLKNIAVAENIKMYKTVGDKKVPLKTKDEYIERLSSIKWSRLKEYARRYKVPYADLDRELEEFRRKLFQEDDDRGRKIDQISLEKVDVEFDLQAVLTDFEPEPIFNEEDLEKQLYQYLTAKYGRKRVRRQVSMGKGKVDIVIDDSIAIEIKIARSTDAMNTLLGQLLNYRDHYPILYALILDVGANIDLDNYISKMEEIGVEPLIYKGVVKKIGRKNKIIINF